MGELIENIHTFVVPGGNPYTFLTRWNYDSWNRLQSIEYPDGEIVRYTYDNNAKLKNMIGIKGSRTYNYINDIRYDKYGKRTYIAYGNETHSNYYYNELNLRLENKESYESSTKLMQKLKYKYDNIGNITSIDNESDFVNNEMGGGYNYQYEYDSLYRLKHSDGVYYSSPNYAGQRYYETLLEYSPSGNILHKRYDIEGITNNQTFNKSISNAYEYSNRPHVAERAGNTIFEWDLNGNMIYAGDGNTIKRYLCWDEENRLLSVNESIAPEQLSGYLYDASGERAWKFTGNIITNRLNSRNSYNIAFLYKTLYVNPYMVVTEDDYTKHYYIEGERVCTKFGGGFGPASLAPTSDTLQFINTNLDEFKAQLSKILDRSFECSYYHGNYEIKANLNPAEDNRDRTEKDLFFYHSDHLGSSSFITDTEGNANQHLQYLPYVELFIDQRASSYNARYKFNAKELDNETGFYYYGARYMMPEWSFWLSVDPKSDKYPSMSAYMYCGGNPVMLVDPNGEEWEDTKYINKKGELLFETNDGLSDIIIVKDINITKLKDNLKKANKDNTINNAEFNKNELHNLGQTLQEYSNEKTEGTNDYCINGYKGTYDKAYNEGTSQLSLGQIISSIISAIASDNYDNSGEMRHSGRLQGILDGNYDKEKGYINRLNPLSGLKNNSPLIKLENNKTNYTYPGKGLPPK